jgi:hypothetical protein
MVCLGRLRQTEAVLDFVPSQTGIVVADDDLGTICHLQLVQKAREVVSLALEAEEDRFAAATLATLGALLQDVSW